MSKNSGGDEHNMFSASAMKARLNKNRHLNEDSLMADAQKMLIQNDSILESHRKDTSRDIALPALAGDSILSNLNNSIQLTAKAKALQLLQDSERRQHRKHFTRELIGIQDTASQASSQNDFKIVGSLENNFDSKSDKTSKSRDQQSYIESSVFKVAEENESEYRDFMIEEGEIR